MDFQMKRQVFSKTHPKKGFLFGKNEYLIIGTINILITCNDQINDIKCLFYYFCRMKNIAFFINTPCETKIYPVLKTVFSKACVKRPLRNRQNKGFNDKW